MSATTATVIDGVTYRPCSGCGGLTTKGPGKTPWCGVCQRQVAAFRAAIAALDRPRARVPRVYRVAVH